MQKAVIIMMTILTGLAVLFVAETGASAFGGCEQDCGKCHSLSKGEAQEALKQLIPDIKVLGVRTSPSRGLWEVSLETHGKKGIAYMDFSKENVIIGQIVRIKTKKNLTRKRLMELNRVDFAQIPLDNALVMGNPNATYKVVVFDDPDCPFCAKLHKELKKVIEKRKDIAFFIKLFPLKMHKDAYRKAVAIQCKKSLKLLEDAYAKKEIPDPECKTDIIDKNIELAEKLDITGTPTIVLENGRVLSGAIKAEQLIDLIKNENKNKDKDKDKNKDNGSGADETKK
ncbi:MAG TPA: DsbC family protein [Nitrospirae bacterium]|nr:DsbC family protein [Nitrospirota bacterium]